MLKQSEAIVLRTYPLREADLLVTLFTRAEGKLRGVAKSAKKSKRRFGGSLEPLGDGWLCGRDKRLATAEMSGEARGFAEQIFRQPVEKMATGAPWPRARAADLRKFLAQRLEKHIEKKLMTLAMLEKIQ